MADAALAVKELDRRHRAGQLSQDQLSVCKAILRMQQGMAAESHSPASSSASAASHLRPALLSGAAAALSAMGAASQVRSPGPRGGGSIGPGYLPHSWSESLGAIDGALHAAAAASALGAPPPSSAQRAHTTYAQPSLSSAQRAQQRSGPASQSTLNSADFDADDPVDFLSDGGRSHQGSNSSAPASHHLPSGSPKKSHTCILSLALPPCLLHKVEMHTRSSYQASTITKR